MERTFFTLIAAASLLGAQAQTTALDFTAMDCAGTEHHLFSELEAGNVVILELVMMGCQPCIDAGHSIVDDVLPAFNEADGVKLYSIGFTNSITCTQMNAWKTNNGFTHTVFAGMSAQTAHYGGMGMPTLAVVGGADHSVYYTSLGHSSDDNAEIITAIEEALAAGTGIAEERLPMITVYPNPATDAVFFDRATWTHARILDVQGRTVREAPISEGRLDIAMLEPGAFVLELSNGSGARVRARFEKR